MAGTPVKLTLYDPKTDEIKKELVKTFIPWKLLKRCVKLNKRLSKVNPEDFTEDDIDELASLAIEVFGEDRVNQAELDECSDITEMLSVIQQIAGKASGALPNPTPPAK